MKTIYFITGMTKEVLQLLDKTNIRWLSGDKPSEFMPTMHSKECIYVIDGTQLSFSNDAKYSLDVRNHDNCYIISYNLSVDYQKQLFMNAFDLNEPEHISAGVTLDEGSYAHIEVREKDVELTIEGVLDIDTDKIEERSFYFSHNEFKRLASIIKLANGEVEL